MAPLPPMPPVPPLPPAAWTSADGKAMAIAHCGPGQTPMPLVDRDDSRGGKHSRVLMLRCGDSADLSRQLDALKKARERFAKGETADRSEEHTSELQSLMRISYAVFCLKKKK